MEVFMYDLTRRVGERTPSRRMSRKEREEYNANYKQTETHNNTTDRSFNCIDCGRPIRRNGRCLACNIKHKQHISRTKEPISVVNISQPRNKINAHKEAAQNKQPHWIPSEIIVRALRGLPVTRGDFRVEQDLVANRVTLSIECTSSSVEQLLKLKQQAIKVLQNLSKGLKVDIKFVRKSMSINIEQTPDTKAADNMIPTEPQ